MIYFKAGLLGFLANLKYRLYNSAIGYYPTYWQTPMLDRIRGIAHNIRRGMDYRWGAWIW